MLQGCLNELTEPFACSSAAVQLGKAERDFISISVLEEGTGEAASLKRESAERGADMTLLLVDAFAGNL